MSRPTASSNSRSADTQPVDPVCVPTHDQAPAASPTASSSSPFPVPERSGAAFDPTRLDALITRGDWIATPDGPLPVAAPAREPSTDPNPLAPMPLEWLAHEQALLAGVLAGGDDNSSRWGLFRRRIGLRYDEPVPARLWSRGDLRLVAGEIDAIFRGLRDVRTINAEALRQDARSRLVDGRYRGSLQELEMDPAVVEQFALLRANRERRLAIEQLDRGDLRAAMASLAAIDQHLGCLPQSDAITRERRLLVEKQQLLQDDCNLSRKRLRRESLRSSLSVWESGDDNT